MEEAEEKDEKGNILQKQERGRTEEVLEES